MAGGLAAVLGAGGDGLAILLENPNSFSGLPSVLRFLAGTVLVAAPVGLAAALLVTPARRRLRPATVFGLGTFLLLFFAFGVRAHVKWFFGEPLTSPSSLLVNGALAAGAALVALVAGKVFGRRDGSLRSGAAVVLGAAVGGALTVGLFLRDESPRNFAGDAPPAGARDVLLVTLDTTRADHLSCYGYPRGTSPALDRLARQGRLWTNVYAPIPLTNPSHASLFTGLAPYEHGVVNNGMALAPEFETFVPALADDGWNCGAFVSAIPLKRDLSGLAPGFAVYDDFFSPLERLHPMLTSLALVRVANRVLPGDLIERRAAATTAVAIAWLRATPAPRFAWVHLFDAHTPYDAPPAMRSRFGAESPAWTAAAGRAVTAWPVADYDAEVREADRHLRTLLRAFDEVSAGRGVVVLTADHGEGLEQHGELTHGTQLYEEDLRVPWLVAGAEHGGGPAIEVGRTRLPELSGWIPALARGAIPSPTLTERPLRFDTFPPEGRGRQTALLGATDGVAAAKLLVDWRAGAELAFDLEVDPGETHPLDPGAEWDSLRAAMPKELGGERGGIDPEVARRLKSLGYAQ